jgi:hypothetical protein
LASSWFDDNKYLDAGKWFIKKIVN